MKSNIAENYLSEADYLAGEQDGQIRHEFIAGEVYAMTGASDAHDKISGNFFAELRNALKHKGASCTAYINDMKVKVQNDFYYPDVMVVCDVSDTQNAYYKTRPLVIVEVLSPATRRIDKTLKRQAYQSLETLEEYVLVEQDAAEVEVFSRQRGWQPDYYYPGDTFNLQSIDVTIAVEDIYYQVDRVDSRRLGL